MTLKIATDTPLARMARTTPTEYWNDSCGLADLEYAIANGAVGATSNPSIVLEVLKKEWSDWLPRLQELRTEGGGRTDADITWTLVEEMAARGAALLEPIYVREGGRKGRLSIQTNPTFFASTDRMLEQGLRFDGLAPNMQVKFPATAAGIRAIEEATFRGVSINATVNYTVSGALAVGAAVERGLQRREAEGRDVSRMAPVCTLMMGRLDDWMKQLVERDDLAVDPAAPNWAGIAVVKRAAGLYAERGFRTRLLAAAFRHIRHWSELVGGDITLTMTAQWQRRVNDSGLDVEPRFGDPVEERILDELYERIPDFRLAYDVDGLAVDELEKYGAAVRTLRNFIGSYYDLLRTVDDIILPNPDVRA